MTANNSNNPDNSLTVLKDSQNEAKNDKDHSHENALVNIVKDTNDGTEISTSQSSGSSGITDQNTNQKDSHFNPNDQSSAQNESVTEIENKSNTTNTSVQPPANSNVPLPMNEGAFKTESTHTDVNSLVKEKPTSGENEQYIDNSSTQAPDAISESVSSKHQQEEGMITSHNIEPASVHDSHVSLQGNDARQSGDTYNNQVSQQNNAEQMDTEQTNQQTNESSSIQAPDSISESVSSKHQQEEGMVTSNNIEPASVDGIHVSLQGNDAGQSGDTYNNQVSQQNNAEQMDTEQINQQTNESNIPVPDSISVPKKQIDSNKNILPTDINSSSNYLYTFLFKIFFLENKCMSSLVFECLSFYCFSYQCTVG
jgi:hypothetical protein